MVRRARSWSLGVEFADLDHLLCLAGFRTQASVAAPSDDVAGSDDDPTGTPSRDVACGADLDAASDAVLGRLVLAARHDELAARVVLQRLLPGLSAAARRWSVERRGGSADAFGEIVSAAWVVIRMFPVERRPGRFAAKLLRDAEHQAFVKATRRRWTTESAEPAVFDRRIAAESQPEPVDELREVVALSRHELSDHDLRLLELLTSGRSIPEVASALDVSVRTVGYHREALVHRLRTGLVA